MSDQDDFIEQLAKQLKAAQMQVAELEAEIEQLKVSIIDARRDLDPLMGDHSAREQSALGHLYRGLFRYEFPNVNLEISPQEKP